jgi:hypothetical protein
MRSDYCSLEELPPPWQPTLDDLTLAGEVVCFLLRRGQDGRRQWVGLLRREDGRLATIWLDEVPSLWAQLDKHRPLPGQIIGIRYLGRGRYHLVPDLGPSRAAHGQERAGADDEPDDPFATAEGEEDRAAAEENFFLVP